MRHGQGILARAVMLTSIALSQWELHDKLKHGDTRWRAFNASFDNVVLPADEIAWQVRAGHAFTTCHSNHWRVGENYICGQHLALDFDAGNETASIDRLIVDPFIERYASFVYSTPSHTDDAPRSRVVFLLDTPIMQPANYVLAARTLLWLYNTADAQCKDAVRFFYGAGVPPRIEFLAHTLSLAHLRGLIAQYQSSGATAKRTAHTGVIYQTPELNEVADALRCIPPWGVSYDEWLSVLFALHHTFGDSALPLAEDWAQGVGDEVRYRWERMSDRSDGVTIATLYMLAKRFGYQRARAEG